VALADPGRRLRTVGLVLAMVLSLFIGRLVQLQGIEAKAYADTAAQQRLRTVVLTAERGEITDVHGAAFATTVKAVNVTADQTQVLDPTAEAQQLAPIVHIPATDLAGRLTGTLRFSYVAQGVSPAQWQRVLQLRLPGIYHESTTKRVYPQGALAADVVGFVGYDGSGLGGIESAYQSQLSGRNGERTYEASAGGSEIPTAQTQGQDPIQGSAVRLTLDRDIQYVAQTQLAHEVAASGAVSGTVVVMDPATGRILALAAVPTFNPNRPGNSPSQNRGNRALSDIYEPGSTSKVMTMAAALDAGVITPNSHFTVPGTLTRGGHTFHDDIAHGTLHLTPSGILALSSNLGTMEVGERLGPQRLYTALKGFGIAEPTGLNFPGESTGLLPNVSTWGPTEFATIAFGQGLSLNSVQATSVFATIANDGVRVQPTLVDGVMAPDGTFVGSPAPQRHRVVSAQAAQALSRMMEGVVSDQGTAPAAQIPGYRVAGKTGTANRVDPSCGCYRGYTASFIGFAPADHPALVVSVTLQNPVNGHFGGLLAAPVFKRVMSYALAHLGIPPTGTQPPHLHLTW
jgi:cell division protein FtsI (penicillin-binding protein 3)